MCVLETLFHCRFQNGFIITLFVNFYVWISICVGHLSAFNNLKFPRTIRNCWYGRTISHKLGKMISLGFILEWEFTHIYTGVSSLIQIVKHWVLFGDLSRDLDTVGQRGGVPPLVNLTHASCGGQWGSQFILINKIGGRILKRDNTRWLSRLFFTLVNFIGFFWFYKLLGGKFYYRFWRVYHLYWVNLIMLSEGFFQPKGVLPWLKFLIGCCI